jgi:predicted Zn-ribbon and HTH transcriptional regulator
MKHKCLRCGHEWQSRIERKPACCPRCKSYDWMKPKKEKLEVVK